MIITDPLEATLVIDAAHRYMPAAVEDAAEKCARTVIRVGEEVGAFIRRESVWVRIDEQYDPRRGLAAIRALWAPDPAAGVLLRGGAQDGATIAIRRDGDGRPPLRLVLPLGPVAPYREPGAAPEMSAVADYLRVGIDSERDMWVYEVAKRA